MKRILLLTLSLVFLFCGCIQNTAPAEIEDRNDELAVYEKYKNLIEALESGEYEAAEEMIDALEMQHYGEAVAQGEIQEISISTDNWNQYFEVQEITQWQQDDLGKANGFITHVCIVLREEYANTVIQEKSSVDFAWQAYCSVKNCSVDLDNRIINLENQFKSQTTTFGEPETMSGTVSYTGNPAVGDWCDGTYIAAEIGEILIIGEYNLKGELKPVCYDYDDTTITHAQGILALRSDA